MATVTNSEEELNTTNTNKKQFKSIVTGLINDPRQQPRLSFADVVTIMKDYDSLAKNLEVLNLSSNDDDNLTAIPVIKVTDFSIDEDTMELSESSGNRSKESNNECPMPIAGVNKNYLTVPGLHCPSMKHKNLDSSHMHKYHKNTLVKPSKFTSYFPNERKTRSEKCNLKRRFSDGYKHARNKLLTRSRFQSAQSFALRPDQTYYLGQTKLFWRSLPSKESQSTVLFESSHRDRLMVYYCTNFTGSHKMRPLVVGSSSDPRVIQNFEAFVNYRHSKDAQITPEILNDWFFSHFLPEVTTHFQNQDLPQRAMLALDPSINQHPPLTHLISENHQIKTIKLSNNIAIDQTVVGLARVQYKKRLLLDAVACPQKYTKLADAIALIRLSWDKVKPMDINRFCRYVFPNEEKSNFAEYNPTAMLMVMQLQKIGIMEIQELLAYFPGGKELLMTEIYNWIYFDAGFIINKNPFF